MRCRFSEVRLDIPGFFLIYLAISLYFSSSPALSLALSLLAQAVSPPSNAPSSHKEHPVSPKLLPVPTLIFSPYLSRISTSVYPRPRPPQSIPGDLFDVPSTNSEHVSIPRPPRTYTCPIR
ncbi:hypothetical protein DACRYDRAFT_24670 [Dacryopinax primogenitus]|uniref:Uncharacterized protein n=1 Tax=Dacryopinax primogenitus (strain DJM 731) TaxID=1858805 RepID=M5FP28_DACPD|nr:uncharacterized protein DACRYDRAFT_24670 [Dacryopinax primogenitus]EJT98170.1 hypothetical protein DACRYDRAFT_24670 [Dacryopinax primogenitus]